MADWTKRDVATDDRAREAEDGSTMQLREEELAARRETVETGEVALRKEVHHERQTVDVPVAREEVVVERHPVDGRPADDANFGDPDDVVRVPVMEEQVTVEKRPVVTEEITLGRRVTQDTERVSAEVRKEEAAVEHGDDVRVRHREAGVPHEGERTVVDG